MTDGIRIVFVSGSSVTPLLLVLHRGLFLSKPQFSHLKNVGDDTSRGCQEIKWVTVLSGAWQVLCS